MSLSPEQKSIIKKSYKKNQSVKKISAKIKAEPGEVKKYIETLEPLLSPQKKTVYRLILLLLPIIFLVLLEVLLRLFHYGGDLRLFITAGGEYKKFKICNPYVGKRYFMNQVFVPDPPGDLFLKEKPANGYRIFVLGGSSAAGYPYHENLLFSRILQKRLSDAFPEKYIEIVNTAMAAINSYTLLDFMDEILENQPDAILIYAGHNEFYGALGIASAESLGKFRWGIKLYLKLKKYKTFLLLRDAINWLRNNLAKLFSDGSVTDPTATLMERLVAQQKIIYGSSLYDLGKQQFKKNL
ncbi:MAG: SGNH/GDSL hydrolase family protein, partial [Calditrichia bacterium]